MPTATPSKGSGEAFGLPPDKTLKRLKISREVAWYMVTRGIAFPEHPPLVKTPEPGEVDPDAVFSAEAVDNVLAAFGVLRHTKGRWAGQPLEPDPWQIAYIIAPTFGWVKPNEHGRLVRIARTLFVDVPRKNGKSTMCGGIALYLTGADGEAGAEVVAAATTRDQAGMVFDPVKSLVEKSPALRGRFRTLTGRILHPKSGSYFKVISSAADAQHGANLHGAVIDELHLHKKPDLVRALETGTGSREQPLIVFITTADENKSNTIYALRRRMVEQLAKRVFTDPTTYGVIFGLPANADPLNPRNWPKANPGYPVSPTHEYLKSAANKARNSPAERAEFQRLHMGQRVRGSDVWIRLDDWDRNAGKPVAETDLHGRAAYGGLDLGSVSDLTALCWLFPLEDGEDGYDAIWRFWTPEENLEALNNRTSDNASVWVKEGLLTLTPGNVTDYDFIREQILTDLELFNVQTIGFDQWSAQRLSNFLMAEGIPIVETRQGDITMNAPMNEAQRLVLKGKRGKGGIHHGGNPVMRWMVDNLAVKKGATGLVKPDKENSADKIDGWSALMNALVEAMAGADLTSAYADDTPLTIV